MIHWFKKVEDFWLTRWLAVLGFLALLILTYLDGQLGKVTSLLILVVCMFGAMFFGILLGAPLAKQLNSRVFKKSVDFQLRLASAFSAFAFLILPALILTWANSLDFVGINIGPFGFHFFGASLAAVLFFCLKPHGKS